MVNKQILKNKGFTDAEIKLIKKHFDYLWKLYAYNEHNIFEFLNFELLKNNKNINIDLLCSSL